MSFPFVLFDLHPRALISGVILRQVPLRIVRHEPKCSTKSKRNPENSAKGVSRNVMGGFYAR